MSTNLGLVGEENKILREKLGTKRILRNDHQRIRRKARVRTDQFTGFLKDKKYLMHDRDPLFTSV